MSVWMHTQTDQCLEYLFMFKDSQPTHTELIRGFVDGGARRRLIRVQLKIQDHILWD